MFDLFTLENAHDFRQRYNNTFGWFYPTQDRKILVMLNGVTDRGAQLTGLYGEKYLVYPNSDVRFEFIPVNKGFKQCSDGKVYHFCRHPDRQWQRGIGPNNTRIHQLTLNTLLEQPWSFGLLAEIFKTECAINKIKSLPERANVALSQEFALSESRAWFFDMVVGERKENRIILTNPLIKQELCDQIQRNNFPFVVED